jgi:hypothetical protein
MANKTVITVGIYMRSARNPLLQSLYCLSTRSKLLQEQGRAAGRVPPRCAGRPELLFRGDGPPDALPHADIDRIVKRGDALHDYWAESNPELGSGLFQCLLVPF